MQEVMNPKQSRGTWPRQGSIVIRVRQQTPEKWAGRVEHVQTGGRGRFRNLVELVQFIEGHLEQPEPCERR
jgi:hypothetical protein